MIGTNGSEEPLGRPHIVWTALQIGALSSHLPLMALIGPTSATVETHTVLLVSVVVTVAALAIYGILTMISSGWTALAVTSVLVIFFWHWSAMQGLWGLPKWLVAVVLFLAAVKALVPYAGNRRFRTIALVVSVTFVSVLTIRIGFAIVTAPPPTVQSDSTLAIGAFERHPDVVLLVLDGYSRDDTLASIYDFENHAILADLNSRGFEIGEEATSNYSITHFSLASLLQMSQVADEHTVVSNSDLTSLAAAISGENQVVATFKGAGYSYVHFETSSWVNDCGNKVDLCFRAPLIDETAFALLEETPVGPFLLPSTHSPVTATNVLRIEQIDDWSLTSRDFPSGPNFVFIHLLVPHPPLFFDSDCQIEFDEALSRDTIWDPGHALDVEELAKLRRAYVEQIKCTNRTILSMIDQLPSDSVVIITADHGSDSLGQLDDPPSWTGDQLRERFGIFAAIRLPTQCRNQSDRSTGIVNTFRRTFSCLTGSTIEHVPEQHFATGFSGAVFKVDSNRIVRK